MEHEADGHLHHRGVAAGNCRRAIVNALDGGCIAKDASWLYHAHNLLARNALAINRDFATYEIIKKGGSRFFFV